MTQISPPKIYEFFDIFDGVGFTEQMREFVQKACNILMEPESFIYFAEAKYVERNEEKSPQNPD